MPTDAGALAFLRRRRRAASAALPPALLASVNRLYDAGPWAATVPLFTRKVPDGSALPYATIEERSMRKELETSTLVAHSVVLVLKVYAASLDEAGTAGDGIKAELDGQRPDFQDARVSPLVAEQEPKHGTEPGRTREADKVYFQEREYRTRVLRSK